MKLSLGNLLHSFGFTTLNVLICLSNVLYAPVIYFLRYFYEFKPLESNELNAISNNQGVIGGPGFKRFTNEDDDDEYYGGQQRQQQNYSSQQQQQQPGYNSSEYTNIDSQQHQQQQQWENQHQQQHQHQHQQQQQQQQQQWNNYGNNGRSGFLL